MSPAIKSRRNPGPNWGFRFLQVTEHRAPRWIFRPALMLGIWVGLLFMPAQRRHSRAYLRVVLGRPPRLIEVWRHFLAFTDFLMLKLRVARGVPHRSQLAPENAVEFEALMRSGRPVLMGSFHFGRSDLLGFALSDFKRRVYILRQRIGNADDTAQLRRLFGEWISFIWVNEPENLLFAIKAAIDSGGCLAMQCDRLEFSTKAEPFQFLGARRMFPFGIYHLAIVFRQPVAFCLGLPGATRDETVVQASPVFLPDEAGREANLRRAREHFQAVLVWLETLVRQNPTLWFNFLPLNPESPAPASSR